MSTTLLSAQIQMNPEDYDGYEDPPPYTPPPAATDEGEGTVVSGDAEEAAPPVQGHWDKRLTPFQKLCLLKSFKEEEVRALLHSTAQPLNRSSSIIQPIYTMCFTCMVLHNTHLHPTTATTATVNTVCHHTGRCPFAGHSFHQMSPSPSRLPRQSPTL